MSEVWKLAQELIVARGALSLMLAKAGGVPAVAVASEPGLPVRVPVLDAIREFDARILEAASAVGRFSKFEASVVVTAWGAAHSSPGLAEVVTGLFTEALRVANRVIGGEPEPVTVTACPKCGSGTLIAAPGRGVACVMCVEAERLSHCQVEVYRGDLFWMPNALAVGLVLLPVADWPVCAGGVGLSYWFWVRRRLG